MSKCGLDIQLKVEGNPSEAIAEINRLLRELKPVFDWIQKPHVRRRLRRAGLLSPRRKTVSTKRARIYRNKKDQG